ncbi:arsenate reductase family protein [Streptomyces zhihengii]|uniref:Arsenate reductase family protein n=1 Tax=Streptomyces zhihengii TaxID=1818004 RepID=A0ABS2UWT0_9ACTN|nr:arsenate reductase family protein [Streptomyces zhihengii]MBM9621971.1 arsenate reductase family protein [Streptomyces zhihengii]
MEIWINPACSKCRSALTVLDAEGADYTVRRYLEDVPTEDEIRAVLERLGLEPWDITRTQEPAAKELGVKDWARDAGARGRWIAALAAHPKLIQRPIITADDGSAVVARTEDAVRDALGRG